MTTATDEMETTPPISTQDSRDAGQFSALRNGPLLALGAGHWAVDLSANILPLFYPLLMTALSLSYASVAALMTVQSVFSSLSQPFFGWLADRYGSRALAPLAVLLSVGAVALVGFAPGYYSLLVVVAMMGLGIGAYHPQGAKAATILGGRWRTTSLSIYMVFGTAGLALAPLLASTVLVPAGLRSTAFLLVPGILVTALLVGTMSRVDRIVMKQGTRAKAAGSVPIPWRALLIVGGIIVIRAWVENGLAAFTALLYSSRGEPREMAGGIMSLIGITMAVGTLAGGWLADRIGRKPTLIVSFFLLAPSVHLFLATTGPVAAVLAAVMGFFLGCPVTITLAAVQEALPARVGMASGIAISLTMIMGGAGVWAQGVLADSFGLAFSMETMVVAALLAGAASLALSFDPPSR